MGRTYKYSDIRSRREGYTSYLTAFALPEASSYCLRNYPYNCKQCALADPNSSSLAANYNCTCSLRLLSSPNNFFQCSISPLYTSISCS